MAERKSVYQVGDLVYPGFTPVRVGKVIAERTITITPRGGYPPYNKQELTVKTTKGEIYTIDAFHVKDYKSLIEDHKRKYEKFQKIAEQFKSV